MKDKPPPGRLLPRAVTNSAVLVVEDDFFVRCDVAGCLREAGYTVIETESGEAAIALCKSEITIDMVFTDINLGGPVTGLDVAERFRSEQPDMPVVYMSGQAINRDRCVPGSVFVAKPYQHIDILSACRRLRMRTAPRSFAIREFRLHYDTC